MIKKKETITMSCQKLAFLLPFAKIGPDRETLNSKI
jgi:hypothetical protein